MEAYFLNNTKKESKLGKKLLLLYHEKRSS